MYKAWVAVADHLLKRIEPKRTIIVKGDGVIPSSGMGTILIDLEVPVYKSLEKDLGARRRDLFLAWSTHNPGRDVLQRRAGGVLQHSKEYWAYK